MKHIKLFEQFVNEKAYQMTGADYEEARKLLKI